MARPDIENKTDRGLVHAFTIAKTGCPVLLAFFARGRGF